MKKIIPTLFLCGLITACHNGETENNVVKQSIQSSSANNVKVGMLEVSPHLGTLDDNLTMLESYINFAANNGAKIIVTPENSTTGYAITKQQSINGIGIKYPYDKFNKIKNIAIKNNAYVIVGFAEIGEDNKSYDSAAIIEPSGSIKIIRKRGNSVYNDKGNLPFTIISTPYGKIGVVICSDTYLMDWVRILKLNGADIVITPANWWGGDYQLNLWSTRAKENGVSLIVSNRWGKEIDTRYDPPYEYDMNDGNSAIFELVC